MGILRMKIQDLVELYQLCQLYEETHSGTGREAAERLMREAMEECRGTVGQGDIAALSNPRGAGRKRFYGDDINKKIRELHRKGMSIRGVAKELGCSPGHVQDVLGHKTSVYGN